MATTAVPSIVLPDDEQSSEVFSNSQATSVADQQRLSVRRLSTSRRGSATDGESRNSSNWATSLRATSPSTPRRTSMAEKPDKLTKTELVKKQLSGENAYVRAKGIVEHMDRLGKELLRPDTGVKTEKKEPAPDVYIPPIPSITSRMSLEARCVRALEYEDAIDTLISEGKLRVAQPKLVEEWRKCPDFTQVHDENEKRQRLAQKFQICGKLITMFKAELDRFTT